MRHDGVPRSLQDFLDDAQRRLARLERTKAPSGGGGGGATVENLNWRGTWGSGTTYAEFDAVTFDDSSYIASAAAPDVGVDPATNTTDWDVLALAGTDGIDGADGAPGTPGAPGADGNTILNGTGAPAGGLGQNGDIYLDVTNNLFYGPKAGGAWGSGQPFLGTDGADGVDGVDGTDGLTVRNGAGAPGGGVGTDGDFYIDTTADAIYGPKTAGAWGSPTSLIGPQGNPGVDGDDGADGADGADGLGVLLLENGASVPGGTPVGTIIYEKST